MPSQRRGGGWLITVGLVVVAFLVGRVSVSIPIGTTTRAVSASPAAPATAAPIPNASAPSTATAVATPAGPSSPLQQPAVTFYVNASNLNVRSSPAADSAPVAQLLRGDPVRVLEVRGDWVAVVTPSGERGWVNGAYLAAQPVAVIEAPPLPAPVASAPQIDRQKVVRAIIAQSQAFYSGNCPCPDNRDRAGRRCGGRSAYSRGGGASPLCYASDVTDAMIKAYLARQ